MENSIVWYRSRKFWAIMYALMLAWSVFFYFWAFFNKDFIEPLRFIGELSLSLGGGFWSTWGRVFFGISGAYLGLLFYFMSQIYFIKMTFSNHFSLKFPVLFLTNYILGFVMLLFILGSFS